MDFEHDAELELKNMHEKIQKLELENAKLKDVVIENGLSAELPDVDLTSVEETISVKGIQHIAGLIQDESYSKDDIINFNTLYNVLRSIRGKSPAGNKKVKSEEVKGLLKMIGTKK